MPVIFSIPSPFRSSFELHRLEFGEAHPDFPTVAIIAGLHGNELNGIHAINLLASVLRLQRIKGKVLLYPIINTFGADECRKRWPFENQDINSIFPGNPRGTTAERIAYALYESIAEAQICIDVHSGASHVRELPQARTPMTGIELEYARDMGMPVIWRRSGEHLLQYFLMLQTPLQRRLPNHQPFRLELIFGYSFASWMKIFFAKVSFLSLWFSLTSV